MTAGYSDNVDFNGRPIGTPEVTGKGYSALMHILGLFVGWTVVVPLVARLFMNSDNEFINHNGREVAQFQLVMVAYALIIFVVFEVFAFVMFESIMTTMSINNVTDLMFATLFLVYKTWFGALFVLAFGPLCFAFLVLPWVAASKASNGELYCYPFVFSPRRKAWKRMQATHSKK